ncbi:MAG: hypothetical protein GKR91_04400 [Pseudomonadales bacterium]|nr:hypothetical protein [Pseudomonadales bacterium]
MPAPTGLDIANYAQFEERILKFYEAEFRGDWETMWNLFAEPVQSEYPLSQFLADMEDTFELYSYEIVSIDSGGPPEDFAESITGLVEVVVERVEIEEPDLYGVNEGSDLWVQFNNDWYWMLRDF